MLYLSRCTLGIYWFSNVDHFFFKLLFYSIKLAMLNEKERVLAYVYQSKGKQFGNMYIITTWHCYIVLNCPQGHTEYITIGSTLATYWQLMSFIKIANILKRHCFMLRNEIVILTEVQTKTKWQNDNYTNITF